MQALVLASYGPPPFPLTVETRPVPSPGNGEVLIRLAASPVNPSDLHFLEGEYAFRRRLPAVPGLEGCGRVVAVGGGLLARRLAGKRVACAPAAKADGTWAQYTVASATQCFRLPDHVSDELGAMALVNPLAAIGLMERVKALRAKSFVSTAAASALGQMLLRLGRTRGLDVINVVRRPEQVDLLARQGATHVLSTSDHDFQNQLEELCRRLHARVALDAIGGDITAQLLAALLPGGRVVVYGGLAQQPMMIPQPDVVFGNKSIEGFYVPTWLAAKSLPQLVLLERRIPRLLNRELGSEVRARVTLDEAPQAIEDYRRAMTGGKILITPNRS
jgi:NADPH:quinone reductase-like Zn-dependent oxidoreductase